MRPRLLPGLLLPFALLLSGMLFAQLQLLGEIGGRIRTANGDSLPHPIMVELRLRGATVNSVYADPEGRFSFPSLEGETYHVVISDAAYYPVDELVNLRPEAPYALVQIVLRPREETRKEDPIGARVSGGNPFLVDSSDYNKHFSQEGGQRIRTGSRGRAQGRAGGSHRAL